MCTLNTLEGNKNTRGRYGAVDVTDFRTIIRTRPMSYASQRNSWLSRFVVSGNMCNGRSLVKRQVQHLHSGLDASGEWRRDNSCDGHPRVQKIDAALRCLLEAEAGQGGVPGAGCRVDPVWVSHVLTFPVPHVQHASSPSQFASCCLQSVCSIEWFLTSASMPCRASPCCARPRQAIRNDAQPGRCRSLNHYITLYAGMWLPLSVRAGYTCHGSCHAGWSQTVGAHLIKVG